MEFTFTEKLQYHINNVFGLVTYFPEWWFIQYAPVFVSAVSSI